MSDPTPELIRRLWKAQPGQYRAAPNGPIVGGKGFTPESVARGLSAMREAEPCDEHNVAYQGERNCWFLKVECDSCWSSMLDAFLEGVRK